MSQESHARAEAPSAPEPRSRARDGDDAAEDEPDGAPRLLHQDSSDCELRCFIGRGSPSSSRAIRRMVQSAIPSWRPIARYERLGSWRRSAIRSRSAVVTAPPWANRNASRSSIDSEHRPRRSGTRRLQSSRRCWQRGPALSRLGFNDEIELAGEALARQGPIASRLAHHPRAARRESSQLALNVLVAPKSEAISTSTLSSNYALQRTIRSDSNLRLLSDNVSAASRA